MKFLLKIIVLVIVVLLFTAIIGSIHTGHVIIFLTKYRIDLSLASLIFIVCLVFLLLYYLIRILVNINYLPRKIREWRIRHRIAKSRKYLNNAGINYFEGKYEALYKNATRSIAQNIDDDRESNFLALLLAFQSGACIRSNEQEQFLTQLDKYKEKKWQLAKLMVIAETEYREQKYGSCLDKLNQVLSLDKKHVLARRLMLKTYLHLNDYSKAYEILTWLIKYNCLEKMRQDNYKLRILRGLFASFVAKEELINFYRKLDKIDKSNTSINKFYFDGLLKLKQYAIAIKLVKSMDNEATSALGENIVVLAKRLSDKKEAMELLVVCEEYLSVNNQNAKLLLATGILSFTLNRWLNAKGYIESSIAIRPCLDGYLYLSFVARNMNDQNLLKHIEDSLIENTYSLTE